MPRRTSSQNLAQKKPSESQNQTQASDPSQRPGKEKVAEQTEVDLAQVVNQQAQLEGMVEDDQSSRPHHQTAAGKNGDSTNSTNSKD